MRIEQLKLSPVTFTGTLDKKASLAENSRPFSEVLGQAMTEVNKLQGEARDSAIRLAAGQIQDVAEVAIASEKASIALQLTMQVRNKAIDAYQEIMRMQV